MIGNIVLRNSVNDSVMEKSRIEVELGTRGKRLQTNQILSNFKYTLTGKLEFEFAGMTRMRVKVHFSKITQRFRVLDYLL